MERTPRRTPRKISENVRELHSALAKVLHNEDRAFLIQSLNQYQRNRDVNSLVVALKSVLNTPRKREVYPLLWQIIPHSDQDIFHNLWHRDTEASPNVIQNHPLDRQGIFVEFQPLRVCQTIFIDMHLTRA